MLRRHSSSPNEFDMGIEDFHCQKEVFCVYCNKSLMDAETLACHQLSEHCVRPPDSIGSPGKVLGTLTQIKPDPDCKDHTCPSHAWIENNVCSADVKDEPTDDGVGEKFTETIAQLSPISGIQGEKKNIKGDVPKERNTSLHVPGVMFTQMQQYVDHTERFTGRPAGDGGKQITVTALGSEEKVDDQDGEEREFIRRPVAVDDGWKCLTCGKVWRHKSTYNRHAVIHLKDRPYVCDKCGKTFKVDRYLTTHMASHNEWKSHQCPICNMKLSSIASLRRHTRSHDKRYRFQCKLCDRTFYNKAFLEDHQFSHSEGKQFVCEICGKSFWIPSRLRKHKTKAHSETQKIYTCADCGFQTRHSRNLAQHRLRHSNLKPYICNVCNKSFRQRTSHKRHMMVHKDVKPFKCLQCDRAFRQKCTLNRHIDSHRGEKKYECAVCGVRYSQSYPLTKHMEKKHPKYFLKVTQKSQ